MWTKVSTRTEIFVTGVKLQAIACLELLLSVHFQLLLSVLDSLLTGQRVATLSALNQVQAEPIKLLVTDSPRHLNYD